MAQITFFDTKDVEWNDGRMYVAGARVAKTKGFSFTIEQEKDDFHGEGDDPLFIQSGNRSYKGEIKVSKGASDDMDTAAVLAGGRDKLDLEWDTVIVYKEKGARQKKTKTAVGCQATGWTEGWDQGAKEMIVTISIKFLRWVG